MSLLEKEQEKFKQFLENWRSKVEPSSLDKFKEKAWSQFELEGLPDRNLEVFKSIKLRALYSNEYAPLQDTLVLSQSFTEHILPECKDSYLVFYNGRYAPSLSSRKAIPEKVVILGLEEAFLTYSALLNNHWNKTLKEETDPFVLLNAALHSAGLFIYIPPKVVLETPIQILQITDPSHIPSAVAPRLQVFAGAQSHSLFALTENHLKNATSIFVNQVFDFSLDEAAHLEIYQLSGEQKASHWQMSACRASLKRNSHFKAAVVTAGMATIRSDYKIILNGENGEAFLNGVAVLKEKNEAHTNIFIDHQAPHCRSHQHFKTILSDFARSSFEGKIMVRQLAQKTEAFQLNNNLVLSEHARVESKPNLEIFADDVKASHGATVGQLNADQLLYMRTRGLTKQEAEELLIHSFSQEIISRFPSLLREKATNDLKN